MEMPYYFNEDVVAGLVSGLFSVIPTAGFGLVTYILLAMGLYSVAKRRGINHAWLAWLPVGDTWILGSLSDQYRYVVKGEVKSKRKVLLTLGIITWVLVLAVIMLAGAAAVQAIGSLMSGYMTEEDAMPMVVMAISAAGLCLPLMGVGIAMTVVRYFALYDLYSSYDPDNKVLYIVLSILINVTEPFFVFFLRNKDAGMPPRKEEPAAYIPPQTAEEPWDNGQ